MRGYVSIVAVLIDQRGHQPRAMPGHSAPSHCLDLGLASDPRVDLKPASDPRVDLKPPADPRVDLRVCRRPIVSICGAADPRVDLRLSIGDVLNDQREHSHVPFEDRVYSGCLK